MSEESAAPLVRSVAGHDAAWRDLVETARRETDMGFRARVTPVDDPTLIGAAPDDLRAALSRKRHDAAPAVIFVADGTTFEGTDWPVLCLDPLGIAPPFRARARDLWMVENNVSTGNMLLEEMADQVGGDGLLPALDDL